MKKLQNFFLFFFIFLLILIAGCKVEVQQTVSTIPSTPSEQQQTPAQEAQSQITQPVPTTIPTTDINSVKCDGQAYNLLVKPKYLIMWIMLQSENKQKIAELKSEGLIDEFVEVIKNEGTTAIPTKQSYKGMSAEIISSRGAGEISIPSGWIFVVANVKVENANKVRQRIQELGQVKVDTGLSGYGMGDIWGNSGDKDIIFEFKCRIPTGPGRVTVYSNIPESSFTVSGTKSYTGNGLCWTTFDVPAGKYTFTFNDVAGYTAPGKLAGGVGGGSLGLELRPEEHLKFGANYRSDSQANTGIIVVITNLPEAKFTVTGPATYSGSGTCWSQANVPTGQYEAVFEDVPGYELSYFDKKKSIYVSSGLGGMQTVESEYKKIGEGS